MQPKAILVLYQPNYKLKNNKYYLSLGSNIVGSDPRCQVQINSRQFFSQEFVANFHLTDDFMYIEPLCDQMVQLRSNMSAGKRKDTYKFIDKSSRLLVPIEEIFYIGPYKAIVQVLELQQLKIVKNVLNLTHFETPRQLNNENEIGQRYFQQQKLYHNRKFQVRLENKNQSRIGDKSQAMVELPFRNNTDAISDRTQKIDSSQQDQFQPTLVIPQNDPYVYEPTLALDQYQHVSSEKKNISSQLNSNLIANDNYCLHSPRRSPYLSPYLTSPHSQQPHTKSMSKPLPKQSQLSDISLFSHDKNQPLNNYSQQILYQSIRKEQIRLKKEQENKENLEEDDFSMPDTIKQQEDAPYLERQEEGGVMNRQGVFGEGEGQEEEQMPATISDGEQASEENPLVYSKHAKSMHQLNKKASANNQTQITRPLPQTQYKEKQQHHNVQQDDLLFLFGKQPQKHNEIDQNIEQKKQIKKKPTLSYQMSNFRNQLVLPHVDIQQMTITNNNSKLITSANVANNDEKLQQPQPQTISPITKKPSLTITDNNNSSLLNMTKKRLFNKQPSKPLKLANITAFKPKPQDKLVLKKRGYQLVPDARLDQYDILIVGKDCNLATQKILMAILLDKLIITEQWLKDKQWTEDKGYPMFTATIEGISWQRVQKQRGNRNIFQGTGVFYLTDTLQTFSKVFQTAGGTITTELNKRKKTSIIINCEAEIDKEFYSQSKNCKNWKFFSHKVISESILIGEAVFMKYLVDGMSF